MVRTTWHIRPELSLSYGLRYEYNTPVKEADRLIEDTFSDPRLASLPLLQRLVAAANTCTSPTTTISLRE